MGILFTPPGGPSDMSTLIILYLTESHIISADRRHGAHRPTATHAARGHEATSQRVMRVAIGAPAVWS